MSLLIEDLAKQMLEQTRLVSNGPVLRPDEALHVDVIPGGAAGGQPVKDLMSLAVGSTTLVAALQINVSYELQRKGEPLGAGQFLRVPAVDPKAAAGEFLSVSFFVTPEIKITNLAGATDIHVGLPKLDHKLIVKITISANGGHFAPLTRTVEIPFTVPLIKVPVPAICICANHDRLRGDPKKPKHLIMLPPGSPGALADIVSTYNSVLDTLSQLETVLSLMSVALRPLQFVVSTLTTVPRPPYVTLAERVADFNKFNDFDDELSSFLLVAPTGFAVAFCDEANPDANKWTEGIWKKKWKKYTAIDILQLPTHPYGPWMLSKLTMDGKALSALAAEVAKLTGVPISEARLGLGVFYVDNLKGDDTPKDLWYYDNAKTDPVNKQFESAIWTLAGVGIT